MPSYTHRLADAELRCRLESTGAVLIEGPKACGKTSTGRAHAKSEVLLDTDPDARALLDVQPALLLQGARPRLLDEWQTAPQIWNHVRRAVDANASPGQFILTGSAVPADDLVRHTGAGRIGRLRMRPMTSQETGFAEPLVRLSDLFDGAEIAVAAREATLAEWIAEVCRGGWPGWRHLALPAAMRRNRDYLDEICRTDVSRLAGTSCDPERLRRFMRAYSRNVGTQAPVAGMLATPESSGDVSLHADTARAYLDTLGRLMVVEELGPWATHLRSRSRQLQTPKRYWVCPSLAVAALRAAPVQLASDLPFFGLLFESLVVRDLQAMAQALDGALYHYRDNTGLEADAVLQLADGRWGAFEIKLGMGQVDAAAESLLRLAQRVDTGHMGEPAFLAVLVGIGRWAYRRPDGVVVLPMTALGV
jgi:predicted AAA+ superfamily ATPase